jgi:hypothetical protein
LPFCFFHAFSEEMLSILASIFLKYLKKQDAENENLKNKNRNPNLVNPSKIRKPFEDAARMCQCSYNTIHQLWVEFEKYGKIISPIKGGRPKLAAEICYAGKALSLNTSSRFKSSSLS